MIESMTFSLNWMKTGRQPGTYLGADEKAVYQRLSYENIDLNPDKAEQLETEDINKKHLYMSREEKSFWPTFLFHSPYEKDSVIC